MSKGATSQPTEKLQGGVCVLRYLAVLVGGVNTERLRFVPCWRDPGSFGQSFGYGGRERLSRNSIVLLLDS
jgi:hypothetical protein